MAIKLIDNMKAVNVQYKYIHFLFGMETILIQRILIEKFFIEKPCQAVIFDSIKQCVFFGQLDRTLDSCDDKIFTFSNGTTEVNVSFLTNESYKNKMYIKLEYNKTNNISIDFTGIPYKILSANAEFLFIENKFFSFVLILAGFLISLYGAYHYNISLVIHIFFLLNFFFCDIITHLV